MPSTLVRLAVAKTTVGIQFILPIKVEIPYRLALQLGAF
jgi:hypothetical protein